MVCSGVYTGRLSSKNNKVKQIINSSRRQDCIYGSNPESLTWVNAAVKNGIMGSKGVIIVHRSHFDRHVQGWSSEKRPFLWATVLFEKPLTIAIPNGYTKTEEKMNV